MQAGWLVKRTRKRVNLTAWKKRWFVMLPGRLTYYESNDMKERKGEFVLQRTRTLEDLDDFSDLRYHLRHRFKVATTGELYEIEMCAESEAEKKV